MDGVSFTAMLLANLLGAPVAVLFREGIWGQRVPCKLYIIHSSAWDHVVAIPESGAVSWLVRGGDHTAMSIEQEHYSQYTYTK